MDAHEIPDQIEWHEGLLLTPQHFQQLTLRQEALLQYVSKTVAPFYWGVSKLKIDDSSLVGGTFKVLELEAVMPDSLVVSSGLHGDPELSVDLTPSKIQTVHLAVPARETNALTKGDRPRFKSSQGRPVYDEETGEEVVISRLRPQLSLEVGERPSRKFVSFPLARVEYRDDAFTRTDYIPPLLSVAPKSELGSMCLQAAKRLREKAAYLADKVRGPLGGAGEAADIKTETLLRSLVAPLPLLEGMLNAGASHPFQVYLALCSVLGQLSVMGWSPLPPQLKPYDHNDLRATFREVLNHIDEKIEEGITSSFSAHPFKYADGVFSIDFEREWVGRRLALGIRGTYGMTEQEVIRWGQKCLIASGRKFSELQKKRMPGARREWVERYGDLVPSRGSVLFSLHPDPEYVQPDDVLQIYNGYERDGERQPPREIILYVMSQQQRPGI